MCKDIYILGGGASGMFAAINAALSAKENNIKINISIIEANDKPGKKILATGNGRCNITNIDMSEDKYHCKDVRFINKVLKKYSCAETMNTFNKLGLLLTEKNGYIYPASMQSSSVTDVLISYCNLLNVKVLNNMIVKEITYDRFSKMFHISAYSNSDSNEIHTYIGDKVLISCGTKAGIKTDYSDNIIKSVIRLGHSIDRYLPALCSIYADKAYKEFFKNANGVRSEVSASLSVNKEVLESYSGELQITDYGLSGIVIFQLSSKISRALSEKSSTEVIIDFLPLYNLHELYDIVSKQLYFDKKSLLDILSGLLNKKLALNLISLYSKLKDDSIKPYSKSMSETSLKNIFDFIKKVHFPIINTNDYLHSQVCSGGVNVKEINSDTMESKLINRLYFSGECINADGICGGYNLQFAWSTGYIAGRSMADD